MHGCLLYKLKAYGINGSLLTLIKRFLSNRFQICSNMKNE